MSNSMQYQPKFVYLAGTDRGRALLASKAEAVLDFPLVGHWSVDELQAAYNMASHLANDYFNVLQAFADNLKPREPEAEHDPNQTRMDIDP